MKKQFILLMMVFAVKAAYTQKIDRGYIDSIVNMQNQFTNPYQYDYSTLEKNGTLNTRFDFIIDTAKKQLLKVVYTEEGNKVLIVSYDFYQNKLIKVVSMTRKEGPDKFPVGGYYFFENKLVEKQGKNLALQNGHLFKKISAGYILKQEDYLISRFNDFINDWNFNE